ncbi:MAG: plasma-membrane proton-efflux P-type ATPase [Methanobacterium paludis]|nr:plasma-membrane proton-efflux P-type ATPase [Methanobacterium paludis]
MSITLIETEEAKKNSIKILFKKLSSSKQGLTSSDAKKRLETFGFNEITERKVSSIVKFLSYFWGPIPGMIEVAIIISLIIGHWADLEIITMLLLLNAVVGFWQEYKAANAVELLKEKLAVNARVLRDKKWETISAKELVPGDIVHVRLGDIVPADLKLIKGEYLSIDESALTGESLPIEKKSGDLAYSGSVVNQGEMDALVVSTGMNTYFGKTAKLVEESKTKSHLKKAVIKIGDYLIVMSAMLVAVIFIVALFRHESFLSTLQFALVLVVASIPVALPAVLSVTMAVGAIALAKKDIIVSKLVSIEEMAGVDVLCSDKTGTITKNELTVAGLKSFPGFDNSKLLLYASLASQEESKDPIDDAIISRTQEEMGKLTDKFNISKFKPFDPVIKRTEASVEDNDGGRFKVAKGAPQVIQALTDESAEKVDKTVKELAKKGYRSLGVSKTDANGKWHYVGVIALYDPPREDSAETIRTAQSLGVDVKMVTGDHIAIAKEISREVDLGTKIALPSEFIDKPDRNAKHIIEDADGFAQVFPEHKYHIVELLQENGHIVGMTGDGVNDAPALKKADVGIDSAETIRTAQSLGVDVKMVTGDHIAIAKEISREVDLGTNIALPSEFIDKPDRNAKHIIEDADGFAQVFPEHKYHIVELLQENGHIVGMTGEGVNDAPALKKADVGIAVSGSTDAAKSAAAIVLTKPGLLVIIDSIKQSRKIFQRMTNYSIYRIAETIRVLFFITFSILIFNFYPVTALMIVLLALLNDAPILTIAYDNVVYSDKPEKWNLRIILSIATFLGFLGVIESFFIFYIGLDVLQLSHAVLQSFMYLKLSVSGHLMVFMARTRGHFWSIKPALPLFLAIVGTQFIATIITVYGFLLPAMGWNLAILIWGYTLVTFMIIDFIKVKVYGLLEHEGIKF